GRGELPDVPHQEDDRILLQGRGLRRQRRRHRLRHPPALQRRGQRGQHFLRHLPVDQALRLVVGLDAEVPLLPHHRDDRCGGALGPQAPALLNCRAGHRGQAVSGRRLGLIAALALVVLANAVVLTGVARNRSGTDARVELTERECPLVKSLKDDDDSGMALELTAHWPNGLSEDGSPGIDRETLRALGFDVSMPLNSPRADGFYRRALPRDAFVVLEMEGPAWRQRRASPSTWTGNGGWGRGSSTSPPAATPRRYGSATRIAPTTSSCRPRSACSSLWGRARNRSSMAPRSS